MENTIHNEKSDFKYQIYLQVKSDEAPLLLWEATTFYFHLLSEQIIIDFFFL